MNAGLIPSRYANALLLFAKEERADARIYEEAQSLIDSLQSESGLAACIESLSEPMRPSCVRTASCTARKTASPGHG